MERDGEMMMMMMMCAASVFCEAALVEVNHQLVHRRCPSPGAATSCG